MLNSLLEIARKESAPHWAFLNKIYTVIPFSRSWFPSILFQSSRSQALTPYNKKERKAVLEKSYPDSYPKTSFLPPPPHLWGPTRKGKPTQVTYFYSMVGCGFFGFCFGFFCLLFFCCCLGGFCWVFFLIHKGSKWNHKVYTEYAK